MRFSGGKVAGPAWSAKHQAPMMRTVIEIGQRVQKSGRRIVGNPPGMGIDHRFQKHRIGIRCLETPDIEWGRKIVDEDALVDADRAVKLIVIEKTASTARHERRLVAQRGQPARQAAMEATSAFLEEVVGA